MERIDLFDCYIKGELPENDKREFQQRLASDYDFAYEFEVYLMTVNGIRREAEQDNADIGFAMKHLTREQLYDILGRKERSISREDIIERLNTRIMLDGSRRSELSGVAALSEASEDDLEYDETEDANNLGTEGHKQGDSDRSLRLVTTLFILIIIMLIIISILM
ncbi:MAG: hypothetical protein K2K82_09595 [Muribaculaceae bacterium]|nr:hypothetical protein [Muribaculaceae bacterium]